MYEVLGFHCFVVLCVLFPGSDYDNPQPVTLSLIMLACLPQIIVFLPGLSGLGFLLDYLPQFYLDFINWFMRMLYVPTDLILDGLGIEWETRMKISVFQLLFTILSIEMLRLQLRPLRETCNHYCCSQRTLNA